ncbi:MAG TPA: ROK family protein [Terriglobales bacterium]|nr:ROK family protein [Terriglobales bacterium]
MSQGCVVGVDIGGTKIAAGIVDSQGQVLTHQRFPMVAHSGPDAGLAAVESAIQAALAKKSPGCHPRGIGICSPGPLDPNSGVIINPPNLSCWRDFPLADKVSKKHDLPVKVENDANAAALAEARWGAGRGYHNVFYTCIGTGIGTGIVFDGVIYHGRTGTAGEGGHMGIDPAGPRCGCGKRGCIEALASGPAIARRAQQKVQAGAVSKLTSMAGGDPATITSYMVGQAAAAGDAIAQDVVKETLDLLGYWLSNIIDLLEPDVIVLGGGVATMLVPYIDDLPRRWSGACVNPWPDRIPVVVARYGEEAGIAGAAALLA